MLSLFGLENPLITFIITMFYIYKMTHVPSERVYVGQRKLPKKCICPYLDKYFGSGTIWKRIYNAHPDECKKEILAISNTQEETDKLEKEYITYYKRTYNELCVNIAEGGSGVGSGKNHPNFGKKFSKETREKMSKAGKGKVISEEQRKKISNTLKGYKWSDEMKKKLSEAHKGIKPSEEALLKRSKALKGRKFSDEHRKKISEALKGKKLSPEHRKKLSEAGLRRWRNKNIDVL